MGNERITSEMSPLDAVVVLSEGNPGATRVCAELLKDGARIDPDNILGGVGQLLMLDSAGLYGARIWMLYKDVCGEDLGKMVAVLRAWQLGIVGHDAVAHAIDHRGDGIDLDDVVSQVQERCPAFDADALSTEPITA